MKRPTRPPLNNKVIETQQIASLQSPVKHARTQSVDGSSRSTRKGSFIINKKSSIINSRIGNSPLANMLFDDVPLTVKQAYLAQLKQQINELKGLQDYLQDNIAKQESVKQVSRQQSQFLEEVMSIQEKGKANPEVLEQSILLSQLLDCHTEHKQIDFDQAKFSYLKDLELYRQDQQLKCSNKFVAFDNEFL